MRLGSTDMEPCIDASPPKGERPTKKASSKTANATSTSKRPSSPKREVGETSETQANGRDASPKVSLNLDASSSHLLSPSYNTALHDGLSHSTAGSSHNHHHHDKTPLLHSAASTRTRRPFSLTRLSRSVGSKQHRLRHKQFKKQQKEQRRHSQPIIVAEGRHPEESTATESGKVPGTTRKSITIVSSSVNSPRGDFVASPASTIKSNTSGGKRRKKQPIKFLRRALSSPPILLQRFHSNPIEKDRQELDASWQDTSQRINRNNNNNNRNNNNRPILPSSSSSSSNSSCDLNLNMAERTRVVPKVFSPTSKRCTTLEEKEEETEAAHRAHCSATSILHHTYFPVLENLCGVSDAQNSQRKGGMSLTDHPRMGDLRKKYLNASCMSLSDDPTIQESIECIFASQLEDGLKLWDEEYDDDDGINESDDLKPTGVRSFESLEKVKTSSSATETLVSPTGVQQSRMNRKDRKDSSKSLLFANMSQTKRRYEQASLVYVGTFDPSTPKNRVPSSCSNRSRSMNATGLHDESCCLDASTVYSNLPSDPLPCVCQSSFLPSVHPKDWPQAPIALRPTPGKGTKIKAIRFSNSSEPLWVPGSHLTWSQRLEQHWGRQTEEELRKKRDQQPHYACCEQCVILPINNGNEKPGESLVTDFETEFFEGTLLLRLRYSEGTTPEPYDDNKGYFKGMNRRYQCCIRGRFKKALPFTQLTTGFKLDRKFGNLPSKWVIKGALKVVRFFAPQIDIKMEGIEHPYSRTPLGSTPQCINVDDKEEEFQPRDFGGCDSSSSDEENSPYVEDSNVAMNNIEGVLVESSEARRSILGFSHDSQETTPLQRAKARKKAFDKLYAQKSPFPKTDPSKIYTFEFLQHMLNFQEFSIELGNMLGSIYLEDILDGQPLPIMACFAGEHPLWSFDVWNECLWKQAQKYDAIDRQKRAATGA